MTWKRDPTGCINSQTDRQYFNAKLCAKVEPSQAQAPGVAEIPPSVIAALLTDSQFTLHILKIEINQNGSSGKRQIRLQNL